jgi:hypothetical protein
MSIQPVKYNTGRGMPASATLGLVGSSFAADTSALFNFNNKRITNTISIENIPDHGELACCPTRANLTLYIVNRRELAALFSKLTGMCRQCVQHLLISFESGEVRSFQDIRDATSARLEITFLDADAAAYVII